jgi:peptide-methionine (S)-S-oxide reductase
MIRLAGIVVALGLGSVVAAWSLTHPSRPVAGAKPERVVGTHPGGVAQGKQLRAFEPMPGDSLASFSAGCFWGAEEAFRKVPGIVATAVGYTGGSSRFPSYEQAHATGHLETVLVEFNPQRTPFAALLKTFWSLPRTMDFEQVGLPESRRRAAIWTYNAEEAKAATEARVALERKFHRKLRVQIQPAAPFYLAEAYHQQYDEKTGTESCAILP